MSKITENLKAHYARKFEKFGATSEGVDWGPEAKAELRYIAMLGVVNPEDAESGFSMLDIGCGYGGQLEFMQKNNYAEIEFTGIDVVPEMVTFAKDKYPGATFLEGDFLEMQLDEKFDYVTCNGILTQKLSATNDEMKDYMQKLIAKMFAHCKKGVVFNTMSSYVDYQMDGNFHNDPSELLKLLFSHTRNVRMDHAYPLYEYSMYMYK